MIKNLQNNFTNLKGGGHSSPTTRAAYGSIFATQKYGGFLTANK